MILFLSSNDYANYSHDMATAYRTTGADVIDLVRYRHLNEYESQSTAVPYGSMIPQIKRADEIHIMHSCPHILDLVLTHNNGAKLYVWHTGTRYRQEPDRFNAMFNPHVEKSFIALGEFSGLGAKNEEYIVGAIDTDKIKPSQPVNERVQVYHLPSNPKVKGTDKILDMVQDVEIDFDFVYDVSRKPYSEQLRLMQLCDIYIELFAPTQDGKPYGSWGITALEAAAMGKVVFTQQFSVEVYQRAYGRMPQLVLCHTEEAFKKQLAHFASQPKLIKAAQESTRKWVVENHSYLATGKKLLDAIQG